MLSMFAQNWWIFVIRGVAAIIFGVAAFIWPQQTLTVLVWLFGSYLLIDGAASLVALIAGDPMARRNGWAVALSGIVSIAIGIAAFVWTDAVALSLLYVVAFWAIVVGTLQVTGAIYLRREIEGELWLALGGILTIAFGVILIVFPGAGLLSLVWLVALWAISFGVSSFALAYELRHLNNDLKRASHAG